MTSSHPTWKLLQKTCANVCMCIPRTHCVMIIQNRINRCVGIQRHQRIQHTLRTAGIQQKIMYNRHSLFLLVLCSHVDTILLTIGCLPLYHTTVHPYLFAQQQCSSKMRMARPCETLCIGKTALDKIGPRIHVGNQRIYMLSNAWYIGRTRQQCAITRHLTQ